MLSIHGREVPSTLEELLDPSSTALLIIDMQNYGCHPDGAHARGGADLSLYDSVTRNIASLLGACRSLEMLIIHVRMRALPNGASNSAAWIRMRMRANANYTPGAEPLWDAQVDGGWEADIVHELRPREEELVMDKYRSSAFHGTPLDLVLRSNGVKTGVVVGSTTEGCVESTVRDVGFHDYHPVLVEDCVASDRRDLHDASLHVMRAYRADVAPLDRVVTALRSAAGVSGG